jgi:hypothetical protein
MENQAKEYGQQHFTLPHDVVPLPSGGLFYKNKKKSIKVGYLTAADENILMGDSDMVTTTLLRNKIYEPDIRVEDLLEGDVEAILIFLRNTSFGPEMTLNLTDPLTKKNFTTTVMLDQLPIIKNLDPQEDGTFHTTLPKSGAFVKLKPLTYGESLEIQKQIEDYPTGRVAPRVTWRLMKQIVELQGTQDKGEIAKFIEQMPISDSKYIKNFLFENEPKIDLRKEITTPSGEKQTVNVGFGVDFFRPFF